MKNKKRSFVAVLALSYLFVGTLIYGQAVVEVSPFKVTADLVSSYVWRGVTSSSTPNLQPTFSYTKGNLEIGAWGSSDFVGMYKETDLYAAYTAGSLKFTLTDYDWNYNNSYKYFDYQSAKTPHIFEGTVGYSGPTKFPISITANVMFAGNDKKFTDPTKQNYSTYVELGYTFTYVSPFLGFTPWNGYYGSGYGVVNGFGVVNFGLTGSKNLKISESYSLPLKMTLGYNPQLSDAYLVFGITF